MRHHILVKWKENIPKPDLGAIQAIFNETLLIPGVDSVALYPNVVDRPNRYDLLILIGMKRETLAAYDASAAHQRWKATYGDQIASKAIFDCE